MNILSYSAYIFVVTCLQTFTQGSLTYKSKLGAAIREELVGKLKGGDGIVDPSIPDNKIIGGWSASSGMISYQAYISAFILGKGSQDCGGSLISRKHVLTAAHCLIGTIGSVVVLGGSNKRNIFGPGMETKFVLAKDYIIHPDYDDINLTDDIAVLRLPSRVSISFTINTIGLPTAPMMATDYFAGMTGLISGFGKTSDVAYEGSDKLQMAYANITTLKSCQQFWKRVITVTDSQICTAFNGTGTCAGDSGGPLAVEIDNKRYLVGITSFGAALCERPIPSVYTNVASYIDWIEAIISLN